jgi:hypothetical protein
MGADNYVKEYTCTVTMPAKVGDTLWGLSDFFGLLPYTVDKPFHCVAGIEGNGCCEKRTFTAEDIGKTLFYSKEDYEKAEKKKIDIFSSLSKSEKAIGKLKGKIAAACEIWIDEHSYNCSYRTAEKRLRNMLHLNRREFNKLLYCEYDATAYELLNIAELLGIQTDLRFIEGIVNETK